MVVPVIARTLLESIELMANFSRLLADKAIASGPRTLWGFSREEAIAVDGTGCAPVFAAKAAPTGPC